MSLGLRVFDRLAHCAGALRLAELRARRGLTILMYHRVLPTEQAVSYSLQNLVVTEECFRRQMEWLVRRAEVVTVREGAGCLGRGAVPDRPRVAISFDDGYADNAEYAAPILESLGIRGTFFVTTGFIRGTPLWFDVAAWYWRQRGEAPATPDERSDVCPHMKTLDSWLGWLKSLTGAERQRVLAELGATIPQPGCEPMSIEQVRGLARAGHEVAAHTVTHPILTRESPDVAREELVAAKAEIESWTEVEVRGLCYPNGSSSAAVARSCESAGYCYATTTRRHLNLAGQDPYSLGRRWITTKNSTVAGQPSASAFGAEVFGLHDALRGRGHSAVAATRSVAGGGNRPTWAA